MSDVLDSAGLPSSASQDSLSGTKRRIPAPVDVGVGRVRGLTSKRVKMPSPSDNELACEESLAEQENRPPPLEAVERENPIALPPFELICPIHAILQPVNPDMLDNMWVAEKRYQPSSDYFSWHPDLKASMRPMLVDWMIEVCEEFTLARETFHLAVNYVDRFLSRNRPGISRVVINPGNYQLLAAASLFIASKLEEIYPPNTVDFSTTTDGAFSPKEIDLFEREILHCLQWELHPQTPFSWLKMFIQLVCNQLQAEGEARAKALANEDLKGFDELYEQFALLLQRFLSVSGFIQAMQWIDMAALDVQFLKFYPSAIAASALYLLHSDNPMSVSFIELCTGYTLKVLRPCIELMQFFTALPAQELKLSLMDKPYFDELRIPREELFGRQQHTPGALKFLQKIQPLMNKTRQ